MSNRTGATAALGQVKFCKMSSLKWLLVYSTKTRHTCRDTDGSIRVILLKIAETQGDSYTMNISSCFTVFLFHFGNIY